MLIILNSAVGVSSAIVGSRNERTGRQLGNGK
uniref:Uncharacterized protein n=1 Tax=Anguilla anguilla TaxID=7936 RepID=A0A0E9VCI0_ANGAN